MSSTISPPSMFSCACRFTITSPAVPPSSSSSFTAGNACTGPCSVPTASAPHPASTNHFASERERQNARAMTASRSQKDANIAIPAPMIRNGWSGVASSAASGVRPRLTTSPPSWKPR